jgi:hypothetical protein
MPCRGRAEQTVRNLKRLIGTVGQVEWDLICVTGGEPELARQLHELGVKCHEHDTRLTYWEALARVSHMSNAPLICNLANDLLPGQHWLQRAVSAYAQTFGDDIGMIGLNDGHHEAGHSCHFVIHRQLLATYGGWPVWYDHNYGDTELCQRAIADGRYAKAPWATLFHDHVYFGGVDDATYAEGRAQADRDHQTYERRRAAGWPSNH